MIKLGKQSDSLWQPETNSSSPSGGSCWFALRHAGTRPSHRRKSFWAALIFFFGLVEVVFGAIPGSEREVLDTIYSQTNGGGWSDHSGWGGAPGTECDWHGVTCDAARTHVTGLYLNGNQLSGTIPSISALSALNVFIAYGNNLSGPIPYLAGLTDLINFDVDTNHFNGAIPSLSGLSSLTFFRVDGNELTGSIPSLSGLVKLQYFSTARNQLTGSIPPLSGLQALKQFDVSTNNLSGTIPSLADLGALRNLYVYSNQLVGVPPDPSSPSSLVLNGSGLCPNMLTPVASAAWDAATGSKPWYQDCKIGEGVKAGTTTTLTSSVNPSATSQGTALVARVSGNVPTGTVTFTADGAVICTAPVQNAYGIPSAYCASAFSTVGTHNITANFSGDSQNLPSVASFDQSVVSAPAFDANQYGLTGSWYNPATSGQGLLLEVYPDHLSPGNGVLAAGWFTYDSNGAQRWYSLQGDVANNVASTTNLGIYEGTGGNFNAEPKVPAKPVGVGVMTFSDCGHATLTYSFSDGSGRIGVIPLVRLSSPSECGSSGGGGTPSRDFYLSGAFYNPATSGQGFFFDISPSQTTIFAAWYTYALNGQATGGVSSQRWFTLQNNNYVVGSLRSNAAIYSTAGGLFDRPGPITAESVGNAAITFVSCTEATITYTFTSGELAGQKGTIQIRPIVPASGCQ